MTQFISFAPCNFLTFGKYCSWEAVHVVILLKVTLATKMQQQSEQQKTYDP